MPKPPVPAVEVDHVDLTYPGRTTRAARGTRTTRAARTGKPAVLRDVQLTVPAGEHLAVIGRSGCGKSTLLHLIGGLLDPTAGTVRVLGDAGTADRLSHCALMPQGDSLLPWFSVRDNVAVPLRNRGVPRREARERATALLERCGLGAWAASRPAELSGGMRQRAALTRALLAGKPVLLADEPLGALDAITRGEIQDWLAELLGAPAGGTGVTDSTGTADPATTMVMVTHDVDEALLLSHRVVLLGSGDTVTGTVVGDWPGWFARRAGRPREQVLADPAFAADRAEILRALGSTGSTHGTDGTGEAA